MLLPLSLHRLGALHVLDELQKDSSVHRRRKEVRDIILMGAGQLMDVGEAYQDDFGSHRAADCAKYVWESFGDGCFLLSDQSQELLCP